MAKLITAVSATLLATRSTSGVIDCTLGRPVRVIMPAAWSPMVPLTFLMSNDNITFYDMYDHTGREVVIVCDGYSRSYSLPPGTGAGVNYLKIRSGRGASPVAQLADRIFSVLLDNTLV